MAAASRIQLLIFHTILFSTLTEGSQRFHITSPLSNSVTIHEGEDILVCVLGSEVSTEMTVTISGAPASMANISAIGGTDYVPKVLSFIFAKSLDDQVQCEPISIVQDGLDEPQEDFTLTLTPNSGTELLHYVRVSIMACNAGDVFLSQSVNSYSIVEYCNNSQNWVTLCDGENQWTAEDAVVVCRQAGYTGSSFQYDFIYESIRNERGVWPRCDGNESSIDNCTYPSNGSDCYPVLVNCAGSSSSNSALNLAAAVTVPLLLLLVCAGVCVSAVSIIFAYRRKKLRQKQDTSLQVQAPPVATSGFRHRHNAQTSQSSEHSSSVRWRRDGNGEMIHVSNSAFTNREPATEVEYTVPTVNPNQSCQVLPPATSFKHLHSQQADEQPNYDGCNIVSEVSTKALKDFKVNANHLPWNHNSVLAAEDDIRGMQLTKNSL